MSLLSLHMGLDGDCQQEKPSQSLNDLEQAMATGGRCFTLVRLAEICVALCPLEMQVVL